MHLPPSEKQIGPSVVQKNHEGKPMLVSGKNIPDQLVRAEFSISCRQRRYVKDMHESTIPKHCGLGLLSEVFLRQLGLNQEITEFHVDLGPVRCPTLEIDLGLKSKLWHCGGAAQMECGREQCRCSRKTETVHQERIGAVGRVEFNRGTTPTQRKRRVSSGVKLQQSLLPVGVLINSKPGLRLEVAMCRPIRCWLKENSWNLAEAEIVG